MNFFTIINWISDALIIGLSVVWVVAWLAIIATRTKVGNVFYAVVSSLAWPPFMYVRFWFILIGLFFIPITFLGDGSKRTPPLWRHIWGNVEDVPLWWKSEKGDGLFWAYWWLAVRNPTAGFTQLYDQPIKEPRPNPDNIVYGDNDQNVATRFLRHEWFSEFWYLRGFKNGKKFEFRVGFKYADGSPGFTPTAQLRYGN